MAWPTEACVFCLEGWWAPGGPLLVNNFCACNFAFHPACMRLWRARSPREECCVCHERACDDCGERYIQSPAEGLCLRCAADRRREPMDAAAHLDDVDLLWRREPAAARAVRTVWRGARNALAVAIHAVVTVAPAAWRW